MGASVVTVTDSAVDPTLSFTGTSTVWLVSNVTVTAAGANPEALTETL